MRAAATAARETAEDPKIRQVSGRRARQDAPGSKTHTRERCRRLGDGAIEADGRPRAPTPRPSSCPLELMGAPPDDALRPATVVLAPTASLRAPAGMWS